MLLPRQCYIPPPMAWSWPERSPAIPDMNYPLSLSVPPQLRPSNSSTGFLSSVGMLSTALRPSFPSFMPGMTSHVGEPWAITVAALPRPVSAMQPTYLVSGSIPQFRSHIRPLPRIDEHADHGSCYPEYVVFVRKDSSRDPALVRSSSLPCLCVHSLQDLLLHLPRS